MMAPEDTDSYSEAAQSRPTKPYQLVCEGTSDQEFFRRLLLHHGVEGYEVTYPRSRGYGEGKSGFSKRLNALKAIYPDVARLIVLAADSDDDPAASFGELQELIASVGLPIPAAPDVVERAGDGPAVAVIMIPGAPLPGNLETLLYEATCDSNPGARECVETLERCTGANNWPLGKLSKMRMAALTAGYYRDNPCAPPAWIWREPALLDIASVRFADLAERLRSFPRGL